MNTATEVGQVLVNGVTGHVSGYPTYQDFRVSLIKCQGELLPDMKTLSNNAELYQYLLGLSASLQERTAKELGNAVTHASLFSAGMSTEFLGESRIVLRRVLKEECGVLTSQERDDVKNVLRQIDEAFGKRG